MFCIGNLNQIETETKSYWIWNTAGKSHVVDLIGNDFYSHIGTDGSTPEERICQHGSFTSARFPLQAHQFPEDKLPGSRRTYAS